MRLFLRENYLKKIRGFYHDAGVIKAITGIRRCSKSCLMQRIAKKLRAEGVDEEHIVSIDLDRHGYRSFMSGVAWKGMSGSPFAQRTLSYNLGWVRDAVGLVVHDDGEQVVAIREAVAFRLVDEDAKFSHCFPG